MAYNSQYTSVSTGANEYNPYGYSTQYNPQYQHTPQHQQGPAQVHGQPMPVNNDYKAPYNLVADGAQSPGAMGSTHHSHKRQAIRLMRGYFLRWLVTVAISVTFGGVVLAYQNKGGMNSDDKHYFNAVSSGLIICLSLNLMSSLNALARALKWRLLSYRPHSPRLFQLIVTLDSSQLKPLRIAIMRHPYTGLRILVIVWLFINLAAQVGTAAIGLTYSMDAQTGTDYSTLLTSMTTGRTAILDSISGFGVMPITGAPITPSDVAAQREAAYDYGVGGLSTLFLHTNSSSTSQAFDTTNFEDDTQRFRTIMTDFGDDQSDDLFNVNSARTIYNNASCEEVQSAVIGHGSETDQFVTNITFTMSNQSVANFMVERTNTSTGTTYIGDTNLGDLNCGPRCVDLYALVTIGDGSQKFFHCWSYVGVVQDLYTEVPESRPELMLPDEQAQILAGSIAWGGVGVSASIDGSFQPFPRYQAASFSNASINSPPYLPNATYFQEAWVGAFPAQALSAINGRGPRRDVDNIIVRQDASDLHVHWDLFILTLGLIAGVQLLLGIVTVVCIHYYRVIIHDDEPFALATLLGPAVAHAPSGTVKNGVSLARSIKTDLVYTHIPTEHPDEPHSVAVNDGVYRQDATFPEGRYM